jgi:hypothetical protein
MATIQPDSISVASSVATAYAGRAAPTPPPPPAPTITLSSDGAAVAGTAEAITVTAANLTGPITVTMESVSGPGVSWSPTTVAPAPGELVKLSMATWAAAGTAQVRGTAPGGIVSNTLTVAVSAAPPPPPPALAAFDTGINGVWTWFTTPVSHYSNGATYFAPVDSTGNSEIHRYDHAAQTTASFTLSASPDVDDHNNGSVEILDDGRIIAYWTTHYDAAVRYRVSSSADSVAAFGTLQSLTPPAGNVTYPVITRLSAAGGKRWLFYRNNNGTTQDLSFRTSADFSLGAGSASAHVALCTTAGFTPYWRIACNDSNRIDVVLVNFHPVQGDNEVYHFYAAPNGSGDLELFRTNGTQITASLPFDIAAQCTQVVTGEVRRKWIWDIVRRPSGEVWVLWTRFMDFAGTDHRLMFSRCTSAGVWQAPVEIVAQGQYLYSGERYYSPGACFDSMDPTTIYLSAPVSGVNQIQRWRTTDSGATWTQQQVYTSGGTAGNPQRARPFSPKNHNGEVPLLWWQGRYTTYLDYDTNIWGAR